MKSHHFFHAVGPIVILCLLSCLTLFGQTKPEQQGAGGLVTGTPVNYSSRRTVGITDPKAPIVFEDVTDRTAISNFRHRSGSPQKNYILKPPRVELRFLTTTAMDCRISIWSTARPSRRWKAR